MPTPLIVVHRRNRIEQLAGLPRGCWIEIDVDLHEGTVWLHHDPLPADPATMTPKPDRLDAFIPAALAAGVAGFVVDCKRENVEKAVQPLLDQHKAAYFYLNEMEVQADIFQGQNPQHATGMRVWKYRGAADVIRMAEDMKAASGAAPNWIWVDCWQRGLLQDIAKAHLPMTGDEAQKLQALGVKLCICSPELYVHKYDTEYSESDKAGFYRGVIAYRRKLESAGIQADSICTKFAKLWKMDLAAIDKSGDRLGSLDFSATGSLTPAELQAA